MKIRKLKFHNINNLKGSHEIDFTGLPLKAAGIFAITGPTGAGKSTILDVITLALFNRIPRFKKAISKGEMQGLGSILTHHTTEASASIEYEIKGQIFLSSWNVSKARTGNLKDYEMSLMDSTGTYLDLKRSEVPAKNEEIIGLKYDQFVKSIILSQGEFSKFLKADKNERGQLLENLTGTAVYRKIGVKAYQKFKEVNESAKLEKARLEDIKILTQEERAEIETSIEKNKVELETLEGNIGQLESLEQVKRELISIKQDLARNTEERQRLNSQTETLKVQSEKLSLHEKLSPLAGELKLHDQAQQDVKDSKTQAQHKKESLTQAESSLQTLLSDHQRLTGNTVDHDSFNELLNAFEQEVLALDRQKEESLLKGKEQRERINQIKQSSDLNLSDKVKPTEALTLIAEQKRTLNQLILSAQLSPDSDIKATQAQLKTQREHNDLLKEILVNLQLTDQINQEQVTLENQKGQIKSEIERLTPLGQKSKTLLETLKEKEVLLQQQKEDALKIASLEELRKDLQDNKPCPLCGATDHPFSVHKPEDLRPELDTKLQETRQSVASEESALTKLTAQLTQEETRLNSVTAGLKEAQAKLQKQAESLDGLTARYQGNETLNTTHLTSQIPVLLKSVHQLEEAIAALEQLKISKELSQAFTDFKTITTAYQEIDQKRKAKFSGVSITQETKALRDRFNRIHTSITALKSALTFEQNRLKQSTTQLETLEAKLSPMLTKHEFDSIAQMNAALLSEIEVNSIRTQRDQLGQLITTNKAMQDDLQARLAQQTKQDTEPETSLESIVEQKRNRKNQRDQLSMQQGGYIERIRKDDQDKVLLASKTDALDKLNREVQKWSLLNKMIGDSFGNKYANFAQGLTLQNLLVYTNRRLAKLSDRYLLDKPTDDGALKVIDQYQGNSERSVSTLSGGETFLLSLALALSLSDMASKNVSLDSLFIDEGFGTLDQETLDVAMTTLERLQSESQKTVGVISHVEALKERINVQIKLQKNAQGYSTIKIEG